MLHFDWTVVKIVRVIEVERIAISNFFSDKIKKKERKNLQINAIR